MAKNTKLRAEDFPTAGTVFAMPLADGRTGICRVVRFRGRSGGIDFLSVLVAASDWVSDGPPSLNDPAVRRILSLKQHLKGSPCLTWILELPPVTFQKLGQIEASNQDAEARSNSYGSWEGLADAVLMEWRWEHDRERVDAENAVRLATSLSKRAEARQARGAYLSTVSFPKLLAKELFPTWIECPSEAAKEECERIIQSLINALAANTRSLTRPFVSAQLQKCVEKLNEFNAQNGNFIETDEREDLFMLFEEIMNAAKHPDLVQDIDKWRDW
jgi:hypothetical protein